MNIVNLDMYASCGRSIHLPALPVASHCRRRGDASLVNIELPGDEKKQVLPFLRFNLHQKIDIVRNTYIMIKSTRMNRILI